MAVLRRSIARHRVASAAASGSTASGRGSARGTRCSRARPDRPGSQRDLPRGRPRCCRASPISGFDVGLPAADSSDRHELPQGPQQRADRRRQAIPAVRGRSARRTAGTPRSSPASGRSTTSRRFGRGRAPRARGRARSRLAVLARSSVGARAPRVVPASARRDDQVRGESAEEIPGHLSVRLRVRRLAGAVAGAARRHAVLDRSRRPDLPRRQPAHQDVRFWEWLIDEIQRAPSGRDLPRRSVHAAEADALPREGRLHAVVHLLHLAEHQGGAERVLHRADAHRDRASTCGRISSRTRRTSCTPTCSSGGRPAFEMRLLLAATLGASYGIYSGFELCEGGPLRRAPRSTRTRRNTSTGSGTGTGPATSRSWSRASTRSGASIRRCSRPTRCGFTTTDNPTIIAYSKTVARRIRAVADGRQSRSASHAARATCRCRSAARHRREQSFTASRPAGRRDATPGAASGTTCGSIPDVRQGHILWPTRDCELDADPARRRDIRRPPAQRDDDPLWYKDAIIYQAHVKSFFDSNNDGIGDFAA